MMNPRRRAQVALALCGTVGFAGWVVASLAGPGSTRIEHAGAQCRPPRCRSRIAAHHLSPPRSWTYRKQPHWANIDCRQRRYGDGRRIGDGDGPPARWWPDQPKSIRINRSRLSRPRCPIQRRCCRPRHRPCRSQQRTRLIQLTPNKILPRRTQERVSTLEIREECLAAEICIDRFLWALYERTPKEDSIKVHEQRKVTVKKKRKAITVTRTFTRLVDQDFTWKDPKAAERVGMPMMDYVIGGMDRSFKLKLFHALHAAEQAGLSPGITSAFRDDYRQSIVSGLKAAADRRSTAAVSAAALAMGLRPMS